jgi:hypothetical protein
MPEFMRILFTKKKKLTKYDVISTVENWKLFGTKMEAINHVEQLKSRTMAVYHCIWSRFVLLDEVSFNHLFT